MPRTEARIHTSIWDNKDFLELDWSAQWAYFTLLAQPGLTLCGVTSYTPGRLTRLADGLTDSEVERAVAILQQHRFVHVDPVTAELLIRTFVRHDGVLDKPNVIVAMTRAYATISSPTIRRLFIEGLGERFLEGLAEQFKPELMKRLAEPFLKGYLERFPKPLVEPFPKPFLKGLHEPLPEPLAEPLGGTLAGTVSGTVHVTLAEPPSSFLHPPTPVREANGADSSTAAAPPETRTIEPIDPLARRLHDLVAKSNPRAKAANASAVVAHLARHVDRTLIDERIGYCATLAEPPRTARYLLVVVREAAAEKGITIPAMTTPTPATPATQGA